VRGGEKFCDLKRKRVRKEGNLFFREVKEKSGLVRVISVWVRLKHYTCQDTILFRFPFMMALA
jgi:hypothetical protein